MRTPTAKGVWIGLLFGAFAALATFYTTRPNPNELKLLNLPPTAKMIYDPRIHENPPPVIVPPSPETEDLVRRFGERHRYVILDAIKILDEREPDWHLARPVDRVRYIRSILRKVPKK